MTSSEVPGGCGKETWSKWGLVHGCCRPDWTQSEVIKSGPNMLVGSIMTRTWGYPSSFGWDRRCLRDFLRVERSYISLIPQIKCFQEPKDCVEWGCMLRITGGTCTSFKLVLVAKKTCVWPHSMTSVSRTTLFRSPLYFSSACRPGIPGSLVR